MTGDTYADREVAARREIYTEYTVTGKAHGIRIVR
jgi:hypothetical protein